MIRGNLRTVPTRSTTDCSQEEKYDWEIYQQLYKGVYRSIISSDITTSRKIQIKVVKLGLDEDCFTFLRYLLKDKKTKGEMEAK